MWRKLKPGILLNTLSIIIFLIFLSCNTEEKYLEYNTLKHAHFQIKYKHSTSLETEFEKLIETWYKSLNVFDSTSTASLVNRNEEVKVDSLFRYTFQEAMDISDKTNGFFDITCAPLINLWGFGPEQSDSVSDQKIDSVRRFVGYDKIKIEGNKVIKSTPEIQLNFSGLGDGAICDLLANFLDEEEIQDYLVVVGGEVVARGLNPDGLSWKIGINKPIDDPYGLSNEIGRVVHLKNRTALATSGNYRNFYIKNGIKYSHTINPKTGYPSNHNILSATVIAPDCLTADAFATAFLAMGLEASKEVQEKIPGIEYLFILSDETGNFKEIFSEGFKELLTE